jgi:hypothetical protein
LIIYIFNYLPNAIGKIREEGKKDKKDKIKLGCHSYPDLIVPQRLIDDHFLSLTDQKLKTRDDSKKIKEWHGIKSDEEIIEKDDFFNKIGCLADYFDFIKLRVFETVVDPNYPIPEIYHDKHDPVIETGTLERCFNASKAFMNMYKLATTDNGVILTAAPMNKMNHSFWTRPYKYYYWHL